MHDYVLVRMDEKKEVHGSLWIPPTAQEEPVAGTVVAVGPGLYPQKKDRVRPRIALQVQEGDRVLVGGMERTRAAESKRFFADEHHVIVHEHNLLAVESQAENA